MRAPLGFYAAAAAAAERAANSSGGQTPQTVSNGPSPNAAPEAAAEKPHASSSGAPRISHDTVAAVNHTAGYHCHCLLLY